MPPLPMSPALDAEGSLGLEEFAHLESLLRNCPGAMSLEQMDGWLAGLVCAPARESVAVAFGPVLGVEVMGEAEFVDDAQRAEVEHLLRRHWGTIAATLEAAAELSGLRYVPLLFEDDTGQVAANEWARGFAAALRAQPAAWASFAASAPTALAPIEALATEPPAGAGPRFDDATRAALVAACAELLLQAWRYFAPARG